MRSVATVLLLATAASALSVRRENAKLLKLANSLTRAQQTNTGQTCQDVIKRFWNQTPADYANIIGSGKAYTDPDFRLDVDGMYWPQYVPTKGPSSWYNSYELARARTKQPQATLFGDSNKVNPLDMNQGSIGDCYFIASCAAVAEWEERVKKIFVTQTYNQEGIIVLKGTVLGLQQTITLDDILPFKKGKKDLLFDGLSSQNSLWGPFIEKAWAKTHGAYERIAGGGGAEVFQFLFGLPTTNLVRGSGLWQTADDIFKLVAQADKNQYIMYTSVPGEGDDQLNNKYGLAKSHAYSLLSNHIIYNADGTERARLFRIRNPWGSDGNYNGTWRDDSDLWNDKVNNYAAQVPFSKNTKDGVFFIDQDQYHDSYGKVQVFFWNDDYRSTTANVWNDQSNSIYTFSFTLTDTYEGFFGVDFYNPRMYPPGCRSGSTSALMMISKDGQGIYSFKVSDSDNYGFVKDKWTPGNYRVSVRASWQTADVRDFAFRTFLPSAAKFSIVQGVSQDVTAEQITPGLQVDLKASLLLPFDKVDPTNGFNMKRGWVSGAWSDNAYHMAFQGVDGKSCTYSATLIAYGNGESVFTSDQPLSQCTKTLGMKDDGISTKTQYDCKCTTTSSSQICSWVIQPFSTSTIGTSASYSYSQKCK